MKFLLDSVIIIDHLNGIPQATQWLSHYHEKACLSAITRAEVLVGILEKNLKTVKSFLDQFKILSITADDADLAAQLRREHHWKLPDALQAALAIRHNLILSTRNTKDFREKQHSFVQIPYELKNSEHSEGSP